MIVLEEPKTLGDHNILPAFDLYHPKSANDN